MRRVLAAGLIGLVLTGCGSHGEVAAVRRVVDRWRSAVVRHDDAAACAELSRALQRFIDRHLLGEGVRGDCSTWGAKWVSPRHPASHRNARITSVDVHGRRATVRLAADGAVPGSAELVKEEGRWRIDDF